MSGHKYFALTAIGAVFGLALAASAANAVTVSVGVATTGSPVQVGSSVTDGFLTTGFTLGAWTGTISGNGNPPAFGDTLLSSQNLSVNTTVPGTLHVFVTVQDITGPISAAQGFLSTFTMNNLSGSGTFTAALTSWLDPSDGQFTTVDLLGGHLYVGATNASGDMDNGSGDTSGGLYSLTAEYTIMTTGTVSSNATIEIQSTPLPATIAMFSGGLGMIGLLARRRKSHSVAV
jgi:hypothetical protein